VSTFADNPLSGHGAHTVTLLGPAAVITLLALGADARARLRKQGRRPPPPVMLAAAACSVGTAAIHALVCPEHFHEGLLYGGFFTVATVAQLVWAWLAIHHPQRWVLAAGLTGNLAIIGLWLFTRTVGIPFGPEAGEVEAIGALDTITAAFEAAIVLCCAWRLTTYPPRSSPSRDLARVTAARHEP
jgi:hypothetical protein